MNSEQKSRLKKLFVASVSVGGLATATTHSARALCTCMPTAITRTIPANNLVNVGGAEPTYVLPIPDDTYWGFTTSNGPTVYADFHGGGSGSGTISTEICRFAYSGTFVACTTTENTTVGATGQYYDVAQSTTGIYNVGSVWDYITLEYSSSNGSNLVPYGAGLVLSW
jgi:hypothetical protein